MDSVKDNFPFPIVAAFDFDGTISASDSLRRFLIVSIGWPWFLLAVTIACPWLMLCVCGFIDRHTAKERLLRASIAGCSVADVGRWTADRHLIPMSLHDVACFSGEPWGNSETAPYRDPLRQVSTLLGKPLMREQPLKTTDPISPLYGYMEELKPTASLILEIERV